MTRQGIVPLFMISLLLLMGGCGDDRSEPSSTSSMSEEAARASEVRQDRRLREFFDAVTSEDVEAVRAALKANPRWVSPAPC